MNYLLPIMDRSNQHPHRSGFRTIKITPIANGYRIKRFSNYIALQSVRLEYLPNGFSKAKVVTNKNYVGIYSYTLYFDNKGNEIKAESTREERKIWLAMQSTTI